MRAKDLIAELQRKLKAQTNRALARSLGMSEMALNNWRRMRRPITVRRVANAVYKAKLAAVKQSQLKTIQPIVEYFPLKPVESRQGVKFELFATRGDANPLHIQLPCTTGSGLAS
jgi:hypothetical protein